MNPKVASAILARANPLFTRDDSLPRDILLLIGAATFIGIAVAIWAISAGKPKASPGAKHHGSIFRRHHHRRVRRREHRPRNPTLAETGGLPPVRSQDSTHRPV